LEQRLLEYSARIIKVVESLPSTRVGNHIADQLLRSGTSPYPNHGEVQAAESPKDFIHKITYNILRTLFIGRYRVCRPKLKEKPFIWSME